MHDTPTKPHVRIRSRDAPPDDPFAFLFPHPRKHPLIIESAAAAAAAAAAAHASSSSTVSRPPPSTAAGASRRSTDAADMPPAAKRARKESDRRTAGERVGTADGGATAAGAPSIIHSADIVHNDLKKYTQCAYRFLGSATSGTSASSSPASPSRSDANDATPTVELVYLSKAYRETFSLLRPKQVVQKYAALASSSTTPPPFPAPKVAVPSDMSEYDPVADLIDTVRMLVQHTLVCPSSAIRDLFSDEPHSGAVSPRAAATPSPSSLGLLRRLERARNRRSRSEFVAAVADFNREYARCKKDGYVIGYTKKRMMAAAQDERRAIQQWLNEPTPPDLVAHVLFQAYARAVAPHADELQKYEAFSNTVYGEINPVFVELLIKTLGIKANHTFLDLGSGIGNVVLHVAARTQCHASGIEIQPAAAGLAVAQLDEFRARLKYFNRRCGAVDLFEGDMLAHAAIPPLVSKADVIFVNNYVFDPKLNRALVELFLDVQEGAKIVSLKEFAPVENRITPRNVHSVEALFDVECFEYGPDYVSWTDQPGKWYVHTMNRKRVQSWLAAQGM
ncbi:Nucleosomal histone H3-Lys79 methylase [Allomyces javanicus]|nr:Nucleosomal histone H3-Lys79 methylase [Allomyces javanicus]